MVPGQPEPGMRPEQTEPGVVPGQTDPTFLARALQAATVYE
ncbi:hypothetical protein ACIO87_21240 [Streptomyces sp. NPDC087218]